MSVLIAEASTTGEVVITGGASVTITLVPTTAAGIPRGASAGIAWKGAGAHNTTIKRVDYLSPCAVIDANGTWVVTKGAGAYTVERS